MNHLEMCRLCEKSADNHPTETIEHERNNGNLNNAAADISFDIQQLLLLHLLWWVSFQTKSHFRSNFTQTENIILLRYKLFSGDDSTTLGGLFLHPQENYGDPNFQRTRMHKPPNHHTSLMFLWIKCKKKKQFLFRDV